MVTLSRPLLGCVLAACAAFPAFAGRTVEPPPSGIVIHLFGPDSVTSHILPTAPGGGATPGDKAAGDTAAGDGATANDPSWSDIAHQMFVTGDPAQEGPNALPKGKAGK